VSRTLQLAEVGLAVCNAQPMWANGGHLRLRQVGIEMAITRAKAPGAFRNAIAFGSAP
jgi:hypothetical protein